MGWRDIGMEERDMGMGMGKGDMGKGNMEMGKGGMGKGNMRMGRGVTIRTYTTDFIYFTCTDTGVIVTHAFIFLPAFGHIVIVDSCAARYCDSELRLTVHYCAL